jgi:hypothetical protein
MSWGFYWLGLAVIAAGIIGRWRSGGVTGSRSAGIRRSVGD